MTESARLTNILLITPLRFVFLIVLVGTTIEVLTERSRQQFRYQRWRRRVKKHTVVIGFGMKGRSAVQALKDQGYPADHIVVVDINGGEYQGSDRGRLRRRARATRAGKRCSSRLPWPLQNGSSSPPTATTRTCW